MATPTAICEIEFSPGAWTDVTSAMRRFAFSRGRMRETDRPEAGTANVVLDNRDGDFEVAFAGPYYPNVRPRKRIRLTANIPTGVSPFIIGSTPLDAYALAGGDIPLILFTGQIASWRSRWSDAGKDATSEVLAVDAFKAVAQSQVPITYASTLFTGPRISEVLDAIGWPADERDIDTGTVPVVVDETVTDQLGAILEAAAAEQGLFFQAPDGDLTFYDSTHVADTGLVFGSGGIGISNAELESDDLIYNDVTVVYANGSVRLNEPSSVAEFGPMGYSLSVPLVSEVDAVSLAIDILLRYSQPRQRIRTLVHRAAQDDWSKVLGRGLLDEITVSLDTTHATTISQSSRIEHIAVTSPNRTEWYVTHELSAIEQGRNLLTANQTSFETGTTGWVADANCSIAVTTQQAYLGVQALSLDPTAAGPLDASAKTDPATGISVVVGNRYVASAWFYTSPGHVEIDWRDGSSVLSTSVGTTADAEAGWAQSWVAAVAPTSSLYGVVRVVFDDALDGPFLYAVDGVLFFDLGV